MEKRAIAIMNMKKEALEVLETQLSCPKGEKGVELGNTMHNSNVSMTITSFLAVEMTSGDCVLEIGHGNCRHLKDVFTMESTINYVGLEISETMHAEAQKQVKEIELAEQIRFYMYDGKQFPFADAIFDKIVTVNTIYFWSQPIAFMKEITRVLKQGGTCAIAFAQKEFMERLPFVQDKFTLYTTSDFKKIIKKSDFSLIETIDHTEEVISKSGEAVTRNYTIGILEKR